MAGYCHMLPRHFAQRNGLKWGDASFAITLGFASALLRAPRAQQLRFI